MYNLSGWLWLRISLEAAIKVLAGDVVSCEVWTGEDSDSKLTHVLVGRVLD